MTKLLIYSDLHLEFGGNFKPPKDIDADIMILAGDIINFNDFAPLKRFLEGWDKPVLFVVGNHEYYSTKIKQSLHEWDMDFGRFKNQKLKNLVSLRNSCIEIDGVNFFGGTMWTDFNKSNPMAMLTAQNGMNDFELIYKDDKDRLRPQDTVKMHKEFKKNLIAWLKKIKIKRGL